MQTPSIDYDRAELPHFKEGNKYLSSLFNTYADAFGVFDRNGNLVACNKAGEEIAYAITGHVPKPGMNLEAHMPPDRRRFIQQVIENVLSGQVQEYERYVPKPTSRWFGIRYYPTYDDEGRIHGFCVQMSDITTRKRAEKNLRFHNTLLQNIKDAVIATDMDFCITGFNKAAEKMYGLSSAEVMHQKLNKFINYKYTYTTQEQALQALQDNGHWEGEVVYTHDDGQVRHLLASVTYVLNEEGEKIGVVAVNKDITDLVQAQAEARRSQAYTRMVLENTGDAFLLLDATHRILLYNGLAYSVMQQFLGKTIAANTPFLELLSPARRKIVKGYLARAARGSKIDYEVQYPSGNWLWVSLIPVREEKGRRYTICMIRDITEHKDKARKELDQKLRQQQELNKAILKAQENERNGIGSELHDNINQILTAIKLQLDICLQEPSPHRPWLQKAQNHVQQVIEEVRNLSRRLVTPRFSEDSLLQKLQLLVESYQKDLIITLDSDTLREEVIDPAVRLALYRVTQEQLNNIVKHAKAQKVVLRLCGRENSVVLEIVDDGIGFQVSGKRKGVGLTNIYNRVEACNGTVRINTAPGNGCKLTVSIPYSQ